MRTTQKTVHLALYPSFADWEPAYLTSRVASPMWQAAPDTYRVAAVASTLEPVTSMGGLAVVPDMTFDQLRPEDSVMLVLPGGDLWDVDPLPAVSAILAATAFVDAGVPVAAICGATAGLARTGLLDDRRHTSSAAEYLKYSGGAYAGEAYYADEPAVYDRGVLTAGPTHPIQFARAALEILGVFTPEVLDAWYRLFSLNDASGYSVLAGAAQ